MRARAVIGFGVSVAFWGGCGAGSGGQEQSSVTIGGVVRDLEGQGLTLMLGDEELPISESGEFLFSPVPAGSHYAITVGSQPGTPQQRCSVANSSGVAEVDVDDVIVICETQWYAVGGTASGVVGRGLALRLNGEGEIPVAADGSFVFPQTLYSGRPYEVTIAHQPVEPWQACSVAGGTGTVGAGRVESITVNCDTLRFTVGGVVSGLAGGLVVQDQTGAMLNLSANGTFALAATVPSGMPYALTVVQQPTSPSQTCEVTGGSGMVTDDDVKGISIACTTNTFAVGGEVSGLVGTGLVLQNNGADDLPVAQSGPFQFPTQVTDGQAFDVTVASQPTSPSQDCTVTGGAGVLGGTDVSSVAVVCATSAFTVGGSADGITSGELKLTNNGTDELTLTQDGAFTFPTPLDSGASYTVAITAIPPSSVCEVSSGSGSVGSAPVTSVHVQCCAIGCHGPLAVTGKRGSVVIQAPATRPRLMGELRSDLRGAFGLGAPAGDMQDLVRLTGGR